MPYHFLFSTAEHSPSFATSTDWSRPLTRLVETSCLRRQSVGSATMTSQTWRMTWPTCGRPAVTSGESYAFCVLPFEKFQGRKNSSFKKITWFILQVSQDVCPAFCRHVRLLFQVSSVQQQRRLYRRDEAVWDLRARERRGLGKAWQGRRQRRPRWQVRYTVHTTNGSLLNTSLINLLLFKN